MHPQARRGTEALAGLDLAVAPGELLVYEDAYGRLAVAVNQGSAVGRLGISLGDELRIAPA